MNGGLLASPLEVKFNPESYKETYNNHYHTLIRGVVGAQLPAEFQYYTPAKVSMTLVFDATGTNEFGVVHAVNQWLGKTDITEELEEFKAATAYFDGTSHEPPNIRVVWGDLDFTCKLTSLSVHYKLFSASGKPLRANVDVEFTHSESYEALKKEQKLKSPDVTHRRTVIAGQTLPMLCKEVYGHERYYLKVARANRLNDFRNLVPGMEIHFPPIKPEPKA